LLDCFREVDVAVTSARHMQRTLAGLGVRDVEIVPNPVDLERFRPLPRSPAMSTELAVDEGHVVVAHPSNLKDLKRPLDLVDAAEIALQQDDRLVFVVVGDGPCRNDVEQAVTARGLGDAFRFTGWVDHDRVPDFINAADIVAMPSAAEAQALVYLETAACERTLIASDIAAAQEVVVDGETGLLFPTGDVPELAATILLAARDPDLRTRLGREARRSVARHSLDRVVGAYAELFESVVGTARRPHDASEII
jgi:1,2-diacylglycerol 3-alpha-glucosyltransferase